MSRLLYRRTLTRLTATLLMCGWGVAWATIEAASPDLIGLPWAQVFVGVLIASWGGATATLGRHLAAKYDNRPFHLRNEVLKDGFVSVTVGGGTYLGGAWYGLQPMAVGLLLLLAGYLGVRILSGAADRFLAVVTANRGGEQ